MSEWVPTSTPVPPVTDRGGRPRGPIHAELLEAARTGTNMQSAYPTLDDARRRVHALRKRPG